MKTLEISTAIKPLSEYAADFDEGMILLTYNNIPLAVIVSLKDMEQETLSLSMEPEFIAIIEKARAEFSQGKKISLDEMKQTVLS